MLVSELREALSKMPGEMAIFIPSGEGISSVKHVSRMNLIGVEQFAEVTFYGGDPHTPDLEDAKIERETGFKNRDELIKAFLKLKNSTEKETP